MTFQKTLMSWIAAILGVLTLVSSVLTGFFTDPTVAPPLVVKVLQAAAAGAIAGAKEGQKIAASQPSP